MGIKVIDKIVNKMISWLMHDLPPLKFPLSDFERLRHEIRPCDVLLVEGRSRVSNVIRMITQSSWTHAVLYIGRIHDIDNKLLRDRIREFYQGDDNEQLIIESLLGKGTIVSPLSHYKSDHIRICRPKGISHRDSQRVIGYAIGRLGVEYDIRHIFDLARFLVPWSIIPRRWRSSLFIHNASGRIREICSLLLAEAFDSVQFPILPIIKEHHDTGIELIPRNPRLFTPSDFDYSPFFEIIKYPIFDMSMTSSMYRNLPWNREGIYSNDDGSIMHPPVMQKEPEKPPLSNLGENLSNELLDTEDVLEMDLLYEEPANNSLAKNTKKDNNVLE